MLWQRAACCEHKIAAVAVLVSLRRSTAETVFHIVPGFTPAQPRLPQQGNLGQLCVEKQPNDAACVPAAPLPWLLSLRAAIRFSTCARGSASFKCSSA